MTHNEVPHRPVGISVPSRTDPLLRRLVEVAGGPVGKHAAPGRVRPSGFTVERVLVLLTTAAAVLSVLVKASCRDISWARPDQFYRACYSDWTEAFQFQGLGSGLFPFTEGSAFEGPALLGVFAGMTALLVPQSASGIVQPEAIAQYFGINAVLVTAAWLGVVIATMRLASRRPWDAALVAVAPIAILTATSGWTLAGVLLGTLALWAFARKQYAVCGILLGLSAGFALQPVLIFAAVLLLAIRTGRLRPAALAGTAGLITWVLTSLPFGLRGSVPLSWHFDPAGTAVSSSIWSGYNLVAERIALPHLTGEAAGASAVVVYLVLAGLIALLVLRAPRKPRLPQVIFLLLAALALVMPAYRPEFTLWLLPFLALSFVDWRVFLTWQLVEVLHWWAFWMLIARDASAGAVQNNIDPLYFVAAVLARLLATVYLMYRVSACILEPEHDPVRRLGIDDPAGGPFDAAPDRSASAPVGLNPFSPSSGIPAPKDSQ